MSVSRKWPAKQCPKAPENIHQAERCRRRKRCTDKHPDLGNLHEDPETPRKCPTQETGWNINLTCQEGARAACVSVQGLTENFHPRK